MAFPATELTRAARRVVRWSVLAPGLLLGTSASAAMASPCGSSEAFSPCFDADALWVPLGPTMFATLTSPRSLGEGRFGAQLAATALDAPVILVAPSQHPEGREVPVVDF